jgi:hypothetical protein
MQLRSLGNAFATPQRRGAAAIALAVIVGLIWWWYPTVSGQAADTDVAIVGDSFVWSAEREITYRVHEDGFSLVWAPQGTGWCDAPTAVHDVVAADHPSIVVISFATEGTCDTDPASLRQQVADAAGSARLVVVENPATTAPAPPPRHAVVVSPSRLLGPDGTIDRSCLWWDNCRPDDRIDVRGADDSLTPAGQTRVARMIVTALR